MLASHRLVKSFLRALTQAADLPAVLGVGRTLSVVIADEIVRDGEALVLPLVHRLEMKGVTFREQLHLSAIRELRIVACGSSWRAVPSDVKVAQFDVVGRCAIMSVHVRWNVSFPPHRVARLVTHFRRIEGAVS